MGEYIGQKCVLVIAGDITDAAILDKIVQSTQTQWQAIDLLIHSAGVSAHGCFEDSEAATLRQIMEVNFFSVVQLTRQMLPLLDAGDDPRIVLLGSILGHCAVPFNSEYVASKHALRGWSQSLQAELHGQGIGVLLVSPGTTETEFFDHLLVQQTAMPWRAQQGISAERVAQQTVRAILRKKREIYPNWRGRLLVGIHRLFPGLVAWWMGRLCAKVE